MGGTPTLTGANFAYYQGGFNTTARDLKPHLKKCKALVLSGLRGKRLGDALGISERTAYNYVNQLIYMGELIEVKGPKNTTPRIFLDGKGQINPYKNTSEYTQIAEKDDDGNIIKRVVGGSNDTATPDQDKKLLNFHCSGAYDIPIIILGDHAGIIRDADGYTIGEWSEVKNANGSLRQYGHARLYPNESLRFTLYLAKDGNKLTTVPVDRDIYYKVVKTEGPRQMADQVNRLMNLLTDLYGWQFGRPTYKGQYHIANRDPALSDLLALDDNKVKDDSAGVFVDYSHGTPEIETASINPNYADDAVTLADLPDHINSIKAGMVAIHGTLRVMSDNMAQLTAITAQIIKQQAEGITGQGYTSQPHDNRGYY